MVFLSHNGRGRFLLCERANASCVCVCVCRARVPVTNRIARTPYYVASLITHLLVSLLACLLGLRRLA